MRDSTLKHRLEACEVIASETQLTLQYYFYRKLGQLCSWVAPGIFRYELKDAYVLVYWENGWIYEECIIGEGDHYEN